MLKTNSCTSDTTTKPMLLLKAINKISKHIHCAKKRLKFCYAITENGELARRTSGCSESQQKAQPAKQQTAATHKTHQLKGLFTNSRLLWS